MRFLTSSQTQWVQNSRYNVSERKMFYSTGTKLHCCKTPPIHHVILSKASTCSGTRRPQVLGSWSPLSLSPSTNKISQTHYVVFSKCFLSSQRKINILYLIWNTMKFFLKKKKSCNKHKTKELIQVCPWRIQYLNSIKENAYHQWIIV